MGVGHVKLRQVGFQHRGRRLLGLQRGDLLLEAQDPGHTDRQGTERGTDRQEVVRTRSSRQSEGLSGVRRCLSHVLLGNVEHLLLLLESRPGGRGRPHQGRRGLGHLHRHTGPRCFTSHLSSTASLLTLQKKKKCFTWSPEESHTYLAHDLASVEHDLVPLAEAILGGLLSLQV